MSPEPNKKIEDLLKRYAEQRKDASGNFELHPATRDLLQGEVRRTLSETAGGKPKSLLLMLWPRLAIAGAFTAMLILTVMVLNKPRERKMEVAQATSRETAPVQSTISEAAKPTLNDSAADGRVLAKREIPAASPAPVTRSPSERQIAGSLEMRVSRAEAKTSEPLGQGAVAERKIEPSSSPEVPAKNFSAAGFARSAGDTAAGQKPDAPSLSAAASVTPAQTGLYADMKSENHWRFMQQDSRAKFRQNLLSPPQPKILQSFELVQNGDKIQLIENDGSIYEGEILAPAQDRLGEKDSAASREQNSEFAFRVIGTNQHLNRVVTFTGNFAFADNQSKEDAPAGALQLGALAKQKASPPARFVHGKVSIAGTNEFEIRATTER